PAAVPGAAQRSKTAASTKARSDKTDAGSEPDPAVVLLDRRAVRVHVYGLSYDYRAEVVRFEGVRPGDVLEVQYIVADVSRGNQLGGYFGDLQFVADTVPKRRWEYTRLGPRGRT